MGEGHAARKNKSRGVHGAHEFKLAVKRVSVSPWGVPNPHRAGYRVHDPRTDSEQAALSLWPGARRGARAGAEGEGGFAFARLRFVACVGDFAVPCEG